MMVRKLLPLAVAGAVVLTPVAAHAQGMTGSQTQDNRTVTQHGAVDIVYDTPVVFERSTGPMTVPAPQAPEGTTFSLSDDSVYTDVDVHEDGSIELTTGSATPPNFEVIVTADVNGKKQDIEVPFEEKTDLYDPVTVAAGEHVTQGLKDPAKADGYKFFISEDTPMWIVVDEDSGELDLQPDMNVEPKDYQAQVIVEKDGGEKTTTIPVTVTNPGEGEAHVSDNPQGPAVHTGGEVDTSVWGKVKSFFAHLV